MASEFLKILKDRGFIHQTTNENGLTSLLNKKRITGYIGFDATAPSLHVGSLVQIMMLRWLQKTGNRPIILIGGGTSKVGDPTWKDTQRPLLEDQTIQSNSQCIQKVFSNYLDFSPSFNGAILVNNNEWLSPLNYIDFLRDYGRHFSINRMMTFDSVKLRLEREHSLSFLEFNYMILQAYDFMKLKETYDCDLQMGGADQWGNIVNGVDLTRRVLSREVFGITSPLMTTANGLKMGKTAQGAVWLNGENLPPYDFWQFWRNTDDADVGRFLRLFTELDLDDIYRLEGLKGSEMNEAKKILADAVTTLAHGVESLPPIHKTIGSLFENKSNDHGEGLPSYTISMTTLETGISLMDVLCLLNFTSSKGEARRLIQGGGVKVNDAVVPSHDTRLTLLDLTPNRSIQICVGKKRYGIIKILDS